MAMPVLSVYSQPQTLPARFQHRRAWSYAPETITLHARFLTSSSVLELLKESSPKLRPSPSSPLFKFPEPSKPEPEPELPVKPRVVSFADEKGHELCQVREFRAGDIEEQAFTSPVSRFLSPLRCRDSSDNVNRLNWSLDFVLPSHDYNAFFTRLMDEFVCLESAFVDGLRVLGFVRVKNISYQKSVILRLSYDGWATFEDIPCEFYQQQMAGGRQNFDQFQFCFPLPAAKKDASIEFAICFKTNDREFWDNNRSMNYAFRVKEKVVRSNS